MSLTPDSAENRIPEAMRLLQQGNAPGAIALLDAEIQENPLNGAAYQYLGVARIQTGDMAGGIAALRQATELMPQNAAPFYNLGLALAKEKQNEAARTALETALALDPAHTKARAALDTLAPKTTPGGFDLDLDTSANSPVFPVATAPGLGTVGEGMSPPVSAQNFATPTPSVVGSGNEGMGAGMSVPAPPSANVVYETEPGIGLRIGRGIGWGVVFGQWWTLWLIVSQFLWSGGFKSASSAILIVIFLGLLFAFIGGLTGLIIGATRSDAGRGAMIGIGVGIVCLILETIFLRSGLGLGTLFNIFWWFFTGRYVGANIGARSSAPVSG